MPPMNLGLGLGLSRRVGGGSIFPWTPQYVLADLEIWQDADDVSTFTFNGGSVAEWRDKTPNARHASQATPANQPTYTASGLNGKPVVTWNAASNHILAYGGSQVAVGPKTIFCVFQLAGGSTRTLCSFQFDDTRFFDVIANAGAGYRALSFMRTTFSTTSSGIGTLGGNFSTAPTMLTLRYNGEDGASALSYTVDTDGNVQAVASSGAFSRAAGSTPALGGRFNPAPTINLPWNGSIAEFIVYDGIPPADVENRIEGYLAHKWGQTANLPAGHPYKSEPPTALFSAPPILPPETDGPFTIANERWDGYTATFSERDSGFAGSVGYPTLVRRSFATTGGATNRILAGASAFNNFNSFTAAYYIGGSARVFRPVNGVMTLIRTSTVTDGRIGQWNWQRFQSLDGQGRLVDDDRVIDGTSYRHTFDTFNRPNVAYWFRVAAVGANNLSGAWSAPVTYTPTAVDGAANNVANTPRTFNRTGSGGALAAPTGLAAVAGNSPRVASLTWSAVAGAEGYIVEMSFYDPATQIDAAPYLELASHASPLLAGDLIIFEKQYTTLDDTIFSSRVFNTNIPGDYRPPMFWNGSDYLKRDGNSWDYVLYSGDKPTKAVGDHFIRRTVAAGQTDGFERFWHSGSDQTFYSILKQGVTYRLTVIMRASAATTATFVPGGPQITGTTFAVGTTFAEYTHDMVPSSVPTGSTPYNWTLRITAGGSPVTFDVAYFKIEEVGASANVLAATVPATGGYLRDHSFIKPGPYNRSIRQIISNDAYGFKSFYDACVMTGSKPWFQIEWNTPREDILDFVAYLAAPDGTNAITALRQASGITEPWTTTFADMKFEGGNEAWNTIPEFWLFPSSMTDAGNARVYSQGNVAGLFWQMMSNWMKESPHWSILAPKLTQHAGGRNSSVFGEDAYRFFPDAKEVSVAAYTGGWDNNSELVSESGLSLQGVLAFSAVIHRPAAFARKAALIATCKSLGRTYGTDVRYAMYEAGPGYNLNGLNGASVTAAQVIAQEVVMKSRAAGAATVDTMLNYAEADFLNYNFFTLSQGDYWTSHALGIDGGQEYISHALVRIINDNIAPARVFGMDTSAFGTRSVTLQGGGTATINQIGGWQLRSRANPSRRMIVLVNRNMDPSQLDPADPLYNATPSGTVPFNITTTWTGATSLRAWTAGIGPFRQHNRYPVGQRRLAAGGLTADPLCVAFSYGSTTLSVPSNIQNFPVNASVGATANGLPAGNCLILLFEGVTGG